MAQPPTERRRRDPIRVAVVDQDAFRRTGLREALTSYGLSVVAEAADGQQALQTLPRFAPDVVMLDLRLPDMDGVEATRKLTAAIPRARVLVLGGEADDATLVEAIVAGACGFVSNGAGSEELASGVRAAYGGAAVLSAGVGEALLERLRERERARELALEEAGLTERELEVLRLIAQGKDTAEIAEAIYASPSTVKNHISNVLAKLQLENRVQMAVYAAKRGLL